VASAAAQFIQGAVAHDSRQPGHRLAQRGLIPGGPVPCIDKRILQHLFWAIPLSHYTKRDAKQRRCRRIVQVPKRHPVALRDAGEELLQVGR
jgi:hypothetical protein